VTLIDGQLAWHDVLTHLRPPIEPAGTHDYFTEIHHQAQAFLRTLAERLSEGAAFFIDYGFPEAEYYHPQRHMGTLMCHRAHQADPDPLETPGEKDITTHVDFTAMAVAAQEAGLPTLGYTTQGRFLVNCGIAERMQAQSIAQQAAAQRLVAEHEMGELFKVIGFQRGAFCENRHTGGSMIRWVIVVFLALVLISWFSPVLQKLGFGKLPGDLRFKVFGRELFIPLTSTILLSMLAAGIAKFL
jgi:SAM-dependent MidA family methyltransferase